MSMLKDSVLFLGGFLKVGIPVSILVLFFIVRYAVNRRKKKSGYLK